MSTSAETRAADSGAAGSPAMTIDALGKGFGSVVVELPGGRIDWTRWELAAVGTARAAGAGEDAARRQARTKSAENAIELMGKLEVGPSGFFLDRFGGGPTVETVLKDFTSVEVAFDAAAGAATARLRVPVHGPVSVASARQVYYSGWPQWAVPGAAESARRFEAVVFDARGADFAPVIYPRVSLPDGTGLFDGFWLRRDLPGGTTRPVYATYAGGRLPEAAALAGGGRAMVLRTVAPEKAHRGSLVVHADDVSRLADCANLEDLLMDGQVAIIVDGR
jgi:hypothetical protein